MSVDSELKKEKRMLMSRTLPTKDDLVGIWQRESIAIDGAEPFEDSVVYWLHAGDFYADMRWPLSSLDDSKKSAFAGAANWSAPYMRFSHELDYTDDIQEDVGHLSVFRGKLLERGEVIISGQTIKFQETWRPLSQNRGEHSIEVASFGSDRGKGPGRGFFVRVEDFVIAMFDHEGKGKRGFSAACWQLTGPHGARDWCLLCGIGQHEKLECLRTNILDGSFPPGWRSLL
jgi:hypothetical protein